MKKDLIISILVSSALGVLIWLFSPYATGMVEPWDSETPYYLICLLSAGFITGALYPRHILAGFIGIVSGQLFYLFVFLPSGSLIFLGVPFMFVYGLLALLGSFLGAATKRFVKGYLTGVNNRA